MPIKLHSISLMHSISLNQQPRINYFNLGCTTLWESLQRWIFSANIRLSLTETGQVLLRRLGINVLGHTTATHAVPVTVSSNLLIPPLPKNTHPENNRARREARAKSLQKCFPPNSPAVYVDAAEYVDNRASAVAVVDGFQKLVASASLPNSTDSLEAEEAAIALAIVHSSAEYIFSDSKTAIRNFATFRFIPRLLKFLNHLFRLIASSPSSGSLRTVDT